MKSPLRVLLLEDNPADAELILKALAGEGIDCEAVRVETRADFLAAVEGNSFDLILSDFSLPSFDGLTALEIARAKAPEVPFIFVSGAMGEELAIQTLKSGAIDYVLKHRLTRLAPAVRRAMEEAGERAARRAAERSRSEAESLFRALFDQMAVGVAVADLSGRIVKANAALEAMLGYAAGQLSQVQLAR
ncbi:MAG: response regulator, partial [Acidobacteriales bacterium]|nr:response regulator [Terriglobales bacterium]